MRVGCKESWAPKNWCFWSVVLEKTLGSHLDCSEVQLVHPKEDQSWVFIGRTDAIVETPVLWPPRANSWLIGKEPDAGRSSGQEEKGTTEDEMAGWHHRLDGCEFEWTPGVGDGQGGLACCDSWGRKESDTTEQLSWTELNLGYFKLIESSVSIFSDHRVIRLDIKHMEWGMVKNINTWRVNNMLLNSQKVIEGIKKISWNKWQLKQDDSKPVGCSKSGGKRDVYSNTRLRQEMSKASNKQSYK